MLIFVDDFQTAEVVVLGGNVLKDYTFWYFLLWAFAWSKLLKFCSHGSMQHGSKLQRRSSVLRLRQRWSRFVDTLPLMSTAAGCAGYPIGQSYHNDNGMINIDVRTLTGEEFRLRVHRSTLGSEARTMVLDNLPVRSGAKLVLDHMTHQASEQVEEAVRLKLHQTCKNKASQRQKQQSCAVHMCQPSCRLHGASWWSSKHLKQRFLWKGWHTWQPHLLFALSIFQEASSVWLSLGEPSIGASLCLTVCRIWLLDITSTRVWMAWPCLTVSRIWLLDITSTRVWKAWSCLTVSRIWLLDITSTRVWMAWSCLTVSRIWLFGHNFDQSLDGVTLPNSLQNLTFGHNFKQSLEGVTLPNSLQDLTFGHNFDQSLDGVTLPNSLQSLTFGFWT